MNGQRSDGQIEMDVVKALDDSQALKNDMITAATIQSQVTLSGTVASDASKQLAESIVSKVPGVTKVNNHLNIGNPADAQNDQSAQPAPETYPDPNDDNGAPQSAQNQNPPQYAPNGQENAPPQYPQQPNDQPQPGYSQNPRSSRVIHRQATASSQVILRRPTASSRAIRRPLRDIRSGTPILLRLRLPGIPFPMGPSPWPRERYSRSAPPTLLTTNAPRKALR